MKKITVFLLFALNIVYAQGPIFTYPYSNNYTVGDAVFLTPTLAPNSPAVGQTTVSTFAGSGSIGSADLNGTSASFNLPTVVAIDSHGTILVVDRSNHKIRKITPSGDVSTFAGSGVSGSADGVGTAASFRYPDGAVFDSHDNLFISDQSNHKIRKITPDGTVSTFAGTGTIGAVDAVGTAASFYYPAGMAVDAYDNLLVADYGNNKIRKITPDGTVSTFAGTGIAGAAEGTALTAQFNGATGVCVDSFGNVFVADYYNNKIRKIDTLGNVTTFAGTGIAGASDGNGTAASFHYPAIVAVDSRNNLLITDEENNKIRKITPDGTVSTFAGSGTVGATDGNWSSAQFSSPTGIAVDDSDNVYVADYGNNKIRKIRFYGFTIAPDLPAGLTLNPITGTISGTAASVLPATNYTITASNVDGQNSFVINIRIDSQLGISNTDITTIQLYPNPVTDILHINAPLAISGIEICNMLGQNILSCSNLSEQANIPVSFLKKGSYIVNVFFGNSTKKFKLIKD